MYWISLDLGSNTGICYWDDEKYVKSLEIKGKGAFEKRFYDLIFFLRNEIYLQDICLIVVEFADGYFHQWNSAAQLNKLIGGVMCLCSKNGFPQIQFEGFSQLKIKQITTGNGRSDKEAVQKAIKLKVIDKKFGGFNESDAIAVGYTYLQSIAHPELFKEKEKKKRSKK